MRGETMTLDDAVERVKKLVKRNEDTCDVMRGDLLHIMGGGCGDSALLWVGDMTRRLARLHLDNLAIMIAMVELFRREPWDVPGRPRGRHP